MIRSTGRTRRARCATAGSASWRSRSSVKRIWPRVWAIELDATRLPRNSLPTLCAGGRVRRWRRGRPTRSVVFQTDPRAAADAHVAKRTSGAGARDACDDEGVTEAVRVLVVSHACVRAANQAVYARLATTRRRRARLSGAVARRLRPAGLRRRGRARARRPRSTRSRVVGIGRPQRHVYVARCRPSSSTGIGPSVVLIEEEPFSVAARQWAAAARARRVPFGVQMAETEGAVPAGPGCEVA